jgi:perosamine synthetase
MCPNAESAYERILSLPIHPAMTDADVEQVITSVTALKDKS